MRKHSRSIEDGNNGEPVTKKRVSDYRVFEAWVSELECVESGGSQESTINLSVEEISRENTVYLKEEHKLKRRLDSFGALGSKKCYAVTGSSALPAPSKNKEISEISHHGHFYSNKLSTTSDADKAAAPKFILSSGRQVLKESKSDGRAPTIDDEFEKYFADLMI
ncbi:hypothetical protein O6H91_13G009900 [Diphasiastrum complanatum]|uniref:Uncharacterized protein n=1 Tax=Diphasiastrum complanatum TaxID=34168 RepID=A0ACC2BSS5_DIPCM|nr:hypothetical protein O6H91_13G009900 [Diphasiastrum complanatum]